MIFSCDTKMKSGFGIEGEKGVEAEDLLTSNIWEVEQPATSWKLKTDHFPGDFAQVSTARLNLTPTYGSDPIDGPWKLTVRKRSLRKRVEVLEPFLQINPRELSSFTVAPSFNFPPNFLCNSFSLPPHYEFCLFHCLHLLQQYFKSKFTSARAPAWLLCTTLLNLSELIVFFV